MRQEPTNLTKEEREIFEAIGKRIYRRRKEKKMKQSDLAALVKISTTMMQYHEQGRNRMSVQRLYRIASVLDVNIVELLGEKKIPQYAFIQQQKREKFLLSNVHKISNLCAEIIQNTKPD